MEYTRKSIQRSPFIRPILTINVSDTLDQRRSLVEAGRVEHARTQYEVIRLACGECRLPDTLEQALDA